MVAMTLPAGHVADTRERKQVIILMQAAMALTSLGLALVSWKGMPVEWVYVCLFAAGVAQPFLWSASASFLPQLVAREEFPLAVNWNSSTFQFSAVTGPAAGGALIALTHSAATVYILNALAALFCLAMICLVRARPQPVVKQEVTVESLLGGFRFVFGHRVILGTITLDLFAVLFGGATALLPVYAKDILKVGPQGLGSVDGGPAGRLAGLRSAHGPSSAHAKSRARPDRGGDCLRSGHGGLWLVALVLVFDLHAVPLRFCRQHQRDSPPYPGAIAHARCDARAGLVRQQFIYRDLQSTGGI